MTTMKMTSSFYKPEFRRAPKYSDGHYGPALYGPYREYYASGEWHRPDGSHSMAGLSGLGMELPELDLSSNGASERSMLGSVAALGIGAAAVVGLGGWWLLKEHYRIPGVIALSIAGLAAVGGVSSLIQGKLATDAADAWRQA